MTARVLVVDDIEPNVTLLEAKLGAEYFDVLSAFSGVDAIRIATAEQPDIILLDVMMPGMDGFETCRRLKSSPETMHIPVIMITALDQQEDRIAGLRAGADDFLKKPVEDVALFARVRSLARLKMMTDELRARYVTGMGLGILEQIELDTAISGCQILAIDDNIDQIAQIRETVGPLGHVVRHVSTLDAALARGRTEPVDLFIVNFSLGNGDPLRLCSSIRSMEETRLTPVLALVCPDDTRKLVRALEIGVNDYLTFPVDSNELMARVTTQLRRKSYLDQLRSSFRTGFEMAVTDQLTGLYNRRYLASHMSAMFDRAIWSGRPLSVMILDIDHFKSINDRYGHHVGDRVLQHFAQRILKTVRGIDLVCRHGGEEFLVAMPDTEIDFATLVAERLRQDIARESFYSEEAESRVEISVSIGISSTEHSPENDSSQKLIKRADDALYEAKAGGRNRVIKSAA